MPISAEILRYDKQGKLLLLQLDDDCTRDLEQKKIHRAEVRLDDGRRISADQRRKIFAIIRDIAVWSGHEPEYIREFMTWEFCFREEVEYFSLSTVDMTTAKNFISYLIEFCFTHGVPTNDTLLHWTDDIERYLYQCLEFRKCAICNKRAEVHHVNRIGMGRDREKIVHVGLEAIALCREHHDEAHRNEKQLFEKYFVKGIKLDEYLCKKLSLNTKERRTINNGKVY